MHSSECSNMFDGEERMMEINTTRDRMHTVFSVILLAMSSAALAICSAIDLGLLLMKTVFTQKYGYGGPDYRYTLNSLEAVNAVIVGVLMIFMICAVVGVLHNYRRQRRAPVIIGIVTIGECLLAMASTVLGTNIDQLTSLILR